MAWNNYTGFYDRESSDEKMTFSVIKNRKDYGVPTTQPIFIHDSMVYEYLLNSSKFDPTPVLLPIGTHFVGSYRSGVRVEKPLDANPSISPDALWIMWDGDEEVSSLSREAFLGGFCNLPQKCSSCEGKGFNVDRTGDHHMMVSCFDCVHGVSRILLSQYKVVP